MFYLTCRFKDQVEFIEAMQLLTEAAIPVDDFGKVDESPPEKKPVGRKKTGRRNPVLVLGSNTDLNFITAQRTKKIGECAVKILKAQEGGKLHRTKLTNWIMKELDLKVSNVSPQISLLINDDVLRIK